MKIVLALALLFGGASAAEGDVSLEAHEGAGFEVWSPDEIQAPEPNIDRRALRGSDTRRLDGGSCTTTLLTDTWEQATQNNLVGHVDTGVYFSLTFELNMIGASTGNWDSILHIGDSNGERSPGLWWWPGSNCLHTTDAVAGTGNVVLYSSNTYNNPGICGVFSPGNTYEVEVKIDYDTNIVQTWVDGVLRESLTVSRSLSWLGSPNTAVYVGDPWYVPANVQVRNIVYTDLTCQALQPPEPSPSPTSALPLMTAQSVDNGPIFSPTGGDGSTGAICFTGESLLTLENGSTKKFRDLEVGDMILSADRNGTISPSPVLFLPHPENDITRKFDEVTLANGMIVRMTRNHLLPLCDGSLVTARSLKKGDCLMTKEGMSKVAKTTQNVEASGIYTAVTKNEFLMVDGIVASPFALAHGIAHSAFDRADVTEWCKDNTHLVEAAKDEEVQQHRRRLTEGHNGCVELMETLFENYKDEGVGWGTNGWGYKNFKTETTSLAMRLSGFMNSASKN